ncbi:MAG: thermosome subunit beta [Candidatus Micrarchaeia archaeon]
MADENKLSPQYYLLPEGASRLIGREAQRTNIAVGVAVANIIKTTLGPKGMDKMLISDLGDIVVTNDGATILNEMNVEHPVAKIMVDVAKTQDKEVGDGTTSVVILAGNLLKEAGEMIEQGVHPTTIISGYKLAADKAREEIKSIAKKLDTNDNETMEKIAMITLGSKNVGDEESKKTLADMVIKAVRQVMEVTKDGRVTVDKDRIKLEKKTGASIEDTEYVNGILVDKEIVHPAMPKVIENAKIALLDVALEIEKTETEARIEITSPEQMKAFLDQEETMLKEMAEKIKKSGANVVFTQKGIDDVAQHFLAKQGISACRRVKKSDMEMLSRATKARIVTTLDDLSPSDLGEAGRVEERKINGDAMTFVENCKDPKSVTIFIRGGSQQIVDEVERSLVDVIGVVTSVIQSGTYVLGGGAIYVELAQRLREYASHISGKEQLAIEGFANAFEAIPKTLAENSGMDPIDTLVQLRSKHKAKDGYVYGVDVINNVIADMDKRGVYEPSRVVEQAVMSAGEAAEMVLRIDDMISGKGSGRNAGAGGSQGGMPPEGGEY